ncbi:hypothetical protein [Cellvibrio fontiphilus]|uniref:ROK family protein n=1 Tax=Cellvibrio fontiphilus TaxID=1815559 RepID=A0ABV7FHF3_9GAMM
MSQGQNSSIQREQNERLILLLMREHRQLSKTDIALLTGLTYPAVARIVDTLATKCLVRKKGTEKKQMGKPTALYEIEANGRLALGIEILSDTLAIAVINFHGNILMIQKHPLKQQTTAAVAEQIYLRVIELVTSMPLEQQRALDGIGIVGSSRDNICLAEITSQLTNQLKSQHHQSLHQLTAGIATQGIAAAAAELITNPARANKQLLYIYIGNDIDGCFIFANKINHHRPSEKPFLASMPVGLPSQTSGRNTGSDSLNTQASLNSLHRQLDLTCASSGNHLDWQQLNPITHKVVADWFQNAARALAFSIEASASLHQLDEIIISSPISPDWLHTLINQIKDNTSLPLQKKIRSGVAGENKLIIGAAALMLIDTPKG